MVTSVLPINPNVITVSVQSTPSGLTNPNVNTAILFTNETPGNSDDYRYYVSAAAAAQDYGSTSVTAAMAANVFAQSPNILTGGGSLIIAPLKSSVSATSGQITTANISANLAAIIAVTNGDIRVTVNGVAQNILGLNFSKATTFTDIAAILNSVVQDAIVTPTANGFQITSTKVGTASTVAMAAATGGTGTALNGAGFFNTTTATATAGANATGETIAAAVGRLLPQVFFAAVMTNLNLDDAAFTAAASSLQAQDLLFFHHFASSQDIAGAVTANKTASRTKVRPLTYLTGGQASANLYKAAYLGRALSVDFNGSLTAATMNLKSLVNVVPDQGITQTLYNQALDAGTDVYVSFSGVPSVASSGGNDYFDNPYSDLSLKFALQTAGFNYLRQTNTKVPQTEAGMSGLKGAYAKVCEQFVTNGEIAPGTWNSSETFGNPDIFRQNIINNGYYIYSLPVALQNVSDRNNRIAPLCQIAIKRAGAIHKSSVIVIVNN